MGNAKDERSDTKSKGLTNKVQPTQGIVNKAYEETENEKNKEAPGEKEEDKNKELPPVGFFSLFKYTSVCDRILIGIAAFIALLSGCSMPAVMILFGEIVNRLIRFDAANNNSTNVTFTKEEFLDDTAYLCLLNALFGVCFIVCNYIMVSFFSITAANQAFKIRCRFMFSILKQDVGWYDTNETGDFASRITGDLSRIQDGIGEKVGICISFISSTILCVGCGMYYGWKLALVILSLTPVLTIAMGIMSKIQASVSREENEAYGKAGAVAEEVLSAIRTVLAFGGEKKEMERYNRCLVPATKKGIKRGLMTSIGASLTWITIYAGYGLAFWYGVQLILEGFGQPNPEYDGGTLLIIFFNVLSASMFIGQTAPYFEAFALARGSAAKIFHIIDRVPFIDSSSNDGRKLSHLIGNINLKNVSFNYPARPTVPVLDDVTVDIASGQTVALVGPSGCGKSTIIQLLLRFYDSLDGKVMIDDVDVKELNVGWLRDNISLVGQEPVLFSTTIAENIRYGKWDATQEEIEKAAIIANVHGFIQALPQKYETLVGDRGTQLSGGQKQRIAIARALIKNPKILLLDEATSALDTESESMVQAALDEARLGRTTVVVAHRLSTIRNADKIIVLSEGTIQEEGTHDFLMKKQGIYYQLVLSQTKTEEEEHDGDEDDDVCEEIISKERTLSALSTSDDDHYQDRKMSTTNSILEYSGKHFDRQTSVLSAASSGKPLEPSHIQDEEEKEILKATPSQGRLLKLTIPEWPYALIGGISSVLMGLHFPAFGIVFGAILGVLSGEMDEIEENTNYFCLLFVLMAITSGICSFLQVFMFTIAGEKLTSRLRNMVFANIISQDAAFFDQPKNSVGSLCSRLTSDASSIQGATGSRMSMILQAISTLVASFTLALWFNYKIGLVTLSFVPFVLIGAYFESQVVAGQSESDVQGTEEASKVAIEAIESIRTVASLHQERVFYAHFHNALLVPHRKSFKSSHVRGIIYGFAQGLQSFAYAAILWYGSLLVADDQLMFADLLKVIEGVMLGVMMVGQSMAFAPDYQKARVAAVRIFKLLDLKPKIDAFSRDGRILHELKGDLRFKRVYFNYPSRHKVKVLRGLTFEIQSGKTVALVGSSGCGKSTVIQLFERFYDSDYGSVLLDNEDVKDLNVANLRAHIGLVSQEPILFSYSIAENIAYGDNCRQVPMDEIISAARQANIHTFITTLPEGYDTPVGDKGTQLSGGQKQRVAIARALLRNPKILLLDEATSALDAESEKVVQDALDKARRGRTCLVIAHRLNTIQNADVIMVIYKGRIVEQGTHQELLALREHYYNLHNTQAGTQ